MAYCIYKLLCISINWPVAKPRYVRFMIKISVSPEKKGKWTFSNFYQEVKVTVRVKIYFKSGSLTYSISYE